MILLNFTLVISFLFVALYILNISKFRRDIHEQFKIYFKYLRNIREEKRLLKKTKAHLKKLYSNE